VGGCTSSCNQLASVFYQSVLTGGVHTVSSPKVAEMEKLLENIFRLVNIGLINEMAILCDRMGIDIWEVIDAAKTKPYGFMAFYPGPGLGGHCIPLDPYYLSWKAKEFNFQTSLIETAGQINREMPDYVVQKAGKILNESGICYSRSKIVLLGVAYKKDIDDYRESPVLKIHELLEELKAEVKVCDPHIREFRDHAGRNHQTVILTEDVLKEAHLVIITTDHSDFNKEMILKYSQKIYDTRNFIKESDEKVIKL
jgi:UDP-N-acetyl-D-glucosamine dehydrogenase